ncbi:MAG: ABC transporter permease subunit [Ancrocorticia sp.]|jgi:putative spermidine/putrescine transport system permease protein|nr:ABC transporter permease subunit [Ancrocorticia sp.]MCI2001562.1 ABC transporter permease subunit [Ancrocorticia sp.]MCI2030013.1 ABC transporter permease subunit [Ancrocorticia sp.]
MQKTHVISPGASSASSGAKSETSRKRARGGVGPNWRLRTFKAVTLGVVLAFLLTPLIALGLYTVRRPLAVTHQWTLSTWQTLFGGAESGSGTDLSLLWEGVRNSLGMSLLTVVLMLLLLVPAMVIARMGHSRLSKALEFLCLMPLAIPAIALVVGLGPIYRVISTNLLNSNSIWLSFAYVILVLPFAYRAIDAGLSELNVMVLFEAATSLGSSWIRTLLTVIIPNIRTAILSACFVSIAVVLGEYTIAAILGRTNLQAALFIINQSDSFVAAAMSLLAILFAILLLVAIDIVSAVKQVHS